MVVVLLGRVGMIPSNKRIGEDFIKMMNRKSIKNQ